MKSTLLTILSAALLISCSAPGTDATPVKSSPKDNTSMPLAERTLDVASFKIELQIAGGRSEAEKARDAGRKPAEVLFFLGLKPGDKVLDVLASGGWYTEVLSHAVGPDGTVYAQNNQFLLEMRDGVNNKDITARLEGGRLPNVVRLDEEIDSMSIPDGSLDVIITGLNFHDVYHSFGLEATQGFLAVMKTKLKPGGVLGIIDHVGIAGQDNENLHRIQPSLAIAAIEQAGFVVDAQSDVLANPADDHTRNVFAEGLRGNTDRFVLRVKKP